VDWSTSICMVVFVKSAPSNCKVVLVITRRSWLHQVKSHNPSATSQLVFVCEDGVSFEHTHYTSSVAMKKCASLGGIVVATGGDVKEGFGLSLGISRLSGALLFLVKE
jgi:hypothetical protein